MMLTRPGAEPTAAGSRPVRRRNSSTTRIGPPYDGPGAGRRRRRPASAPWGSDVYLYTLDVVVGQGCWRPGSSGAGPAAAAGSVGPVGGQLVAAAARNLVR